MRNNRVYVVEDMAVSRTALEILLLKNKYDVVGSASNAEKAWQELRQLQVDIVLLDVNLGSGQSGTHLAGQIRAEMDLKIVYLTAYSDHQTMKTVMETKPDGFILKPYNEVSVLTNLKIVIDSISRVKSDFLTIGSKKTMRNLKQSDIKMVYSDANYVKIVLPNSNHITRSKLSDISIKLNSHFIQVHRRFIVNTDFVKRIEGDQLWISDEEESIPISKLYKKSVLERCKEL
ncbi:MAG: hypothetical protein COA58_12570 [Bacteroidetes bacterium]|nr:MAG: hypothetical protein COA58_12570 [Bacteroidota bacterium]